MVLGIKCRIYLRDQKLQIFDVGEVVRKATHNGVTGVIALNTRRQVVPELLHTSEQREPTSGEVKLAIINRTDNTANIKRPLHLTVTR